MLSWFPFLSQRVLAYCFRYCYDDEASVFVGNLPSRCRLLMPRDRWNTTLRRYKLLFFFFSELLACYRCVHVTEALWRQPKQQRFFFLFERNILERRSLTYIIIWC